MASASILRCASLARASTHQAHCPSAEGQRGPRCSIGGRESELNPLSRRFGSQIPLHSLRLLGLPVPGAQQRLDARNQQPVNRVGAQSRGSGQEGTDSADQTSHLESSAELTVRQHNWKELALWLFLAGFFLGAPLDGLHSVVGLQVYDGPAAITIGSPVDGLLTSLWVPPLLGIMHLVVGCLQLVLDSGFPPSASSPAAKGSPVQMLMHLPVLIGLLRLSSLLYENNFSPMFILGVLVIFSNGSWYCFDRTLPGYILALVVGLGAPLCEVLCLKLGMWHYSTPDVFIAEEGLVSWTTCCYFFYTQWVASVARALDSILSPVALPESAASSQREE